MYVSELLTKTLKKLLNNFSSYRRLLRLYFFCFYFRKAALSLSGQRALGPEGATALQMVTQDWSCPPQLAPLKRSLLLNWSLGYAWMWQNRGYKAKNDHHEQLFTPGNPRLPKPIIGQWVDTSLCLLWLVVSKQTEPKEVSMSLYSRSSQSNHCPKVPKDLGS